MRPSAYTPLRTATRAQPNRYKVRYWDRWLPREQPAGTPTAKPKEAK